MFSQGVTIMKKVPYGIANFEAIKENSNYYYVDKTRYIEQIENLGSKYHFFLRPRRFGKSLFLSMLEHYYDMNRKNQFDELFGDTYIGKNPTPLRNSFPVLKLNFSGIPTHGTEAQTEHSFKVKFIGDIELFFSKYTKHFNIGENIKNIVLAEKTTSDILNRFIAKMYECGVKYLMLIDEYDNFANNVLIHHGKDNYLALTHKGGFLRSFFAAIKNATETRTVERMFVTGVSPLVLSDVTSGMNIGDNISKNSIFNSMIGFDQKEVETMLDYYIDEKAVKSDERDEILEIFKVNYNNYCFSEKTSEKIYNSDMILYFFNNYFQDKKIPNDFLDENVRIDYGKLQFLILESKKLNGNFDLLSKLIEKKEVTTELIHSFALKDIIDENKFKSFLYYLGLLTIKEHIFGNNFVLNIPNEVIKTMHFDYIRQSLRDGYELKINIDFLKQEFMQLAFKGEWKALFDYIIKKFYEAVSIRDFVFREQGIKMFILAYLNVTPLYFILSEPEMNRGFADIFLQKNYFTTDKTKFEFIIETKYVTKEELSSNSSVDYYIAEAKDQLMKYSQSQKITCPLKKIIIIASANELLYMGDYE